MKKFYLFVFSLFLIFNIHASEVLNGIEIEYQNNIITTSTRSYSNDRYIFQIDYIGDVMDLSNEQLDFILNQESNDYLKVFGDINVRVHDIKKNNVFVGYSGGMFGNSLNEDVMPNDIANLENLSFVVKNPIMEVYYRKDSNSAWKNDKGTLSGVLSIKEQLSKLLDINLNDVKAQYKTLYYFKPYEDSVYTNRFDFYESNSMVSPLSENDYDVNNLKKINHEYALLKFDYSSSNVFFENNVSNESYNILYVIITSVLVCLFSFCVLKWKRIV